MNNVSMTVEVGEILGFIGPNGSGKSTTMKMATGYLKADSGYFYHLSCKNVKLIERGKKTHRIFTRGRAGLR